MNYLIPGGFIIKNAWVKWMVVSVGVLPLTGQNIRDINRYIENPRMESEKCFRSPCSSSPVPVEYIPVDSKNLNRMRLCSVWAG